MMLHNNGWRIVREGADYYLIPPPTEDFSQQPIPMPSKSRTQRRARRAEPQPALARAG